MNIHMCEYIHKYSYRCRMHTIYILFIMLLYVFILYISDLGWDVSFKYLSSSIIEHCSN